MIFFEKSQPAPTSLALEKQKVSGSYNQPDVLDRLIDDFSNKCYLCEQNDLTTMNIEHLRPHRGDLDLKFDWNNLFLACPHCNNIKLDRYDNILNCTVEADEAESRIKLKLDPFPMSEVEVTVNQTDARTLQTAELLKAIYNGTTFMKTREAENLNKKIAEEIHQFLQLLRGYMNAKKNDDQEALQDFNRKIRYSLQKTSPFTSFKRWIIRENDKRNAEFGHLFDTDK